MDFIGLILCFRNGEVKSYYEFCPFSLLCFYFYFSALGIDDFSRYGHIQRRVLVHHMHGILIMLKGHKEIPRDLLVQSRTVIANMNLVPCVFLIRSHALDFLNGQPDTSLVAGELAGGSEKIDQNTV